MKNFISQHKILLLSISLITFFVLLQIKPFFSPAYVPDEAWFYWLAEQKAAEMNPSNFLVFLFTQSNELGYGALYWIVYSLHTDLLSAIGLTKEVIFGIARIISLLFVASVPVLLLLYGQLKKHPLTIYVILLWFSFPVSWWYGKITAPEPLLIFLCTLGLFLIFPPKDWSLHKKMSSLFGWFALGLGVGLKLNFLPVIVFAIIFSLYTNGTKLKENVLRLTSLLAGFIVANPFILTGLNTYLGNIKSAATGSLPDFSQLLFIISNHYWEWDLILNGGLLEWSMSGGVFVLFIVFLISQKKHPLTLIFVGTFMFAILLFLSNSRFLGWYWFPLLPLIPLSVLFIDNYKARSIQLFAFLVGMSLATNFGQIAYSYDLREEHTRNLSAVALIQTCLDQELIDSEKEYDSIINMSEIRLKLTHDATPIEFYPSYQSLNLEGKSILFLMGSRVQKISPYSEIYKKLESSSFLQDGHTYQVVRSHQCGFVNFYELTKKYAN